VRRPVGEVADARAERLRVDELQRLPIHAALAEALTAAHDYGMDHEPEFVEEVLLQQRPEEVGLPEIPTSLFGCGLSSVISSARLPSIGVELFHPRGSSRVLETTYLGVSFM
jgi:hypothetical protein